MVVVLDDLTLGSTAVVPVLAAFALPASALSATLGSVGLRRRRSSQRVAR